jgi:hypothetical protein
MKIKAFTVIQKVEIKKREHWAPAQKAFKNKKKYNRRDFKLAFA